MFDKKDEYNGETCRDVQLVAGFSARELSKDMKEQST